MAIFFLGGAIGSSSIGVCAYALCGWSTALWIRIFPSAVGKKVKSPRLKHYSHNKQHSWITSKINVISHTISEYCPYVFNLSSTKKSRFTVKKRTGISSLAIKIYTKTQLPTRVKIPAFCYIPFSFMIDTTLLSISPV